MPISNTELLWNMFLFYHRYTSLKCITFMPSVGLTDCGSVGVMFSSLLLAYIHCMDSLWQFWVALHAHWLNWHDHPLPQKPLNVPVKVIAGGFIIIFHTWIKHNKPCFLSFIFFHPPSSQQYAPYAIIILHSCPSLLVPKSVFNLFSWCIPDINLLWSVQPLSLLSLAPSLPPLFISFKYTHILTFSAFTPYVSSVVLMLCHSLFLSLLPRLWQSISTITNMFCI
jgi:hypothetical protein